MEQSRLEMADEVLATADELRAASQQGLEQEGWLSNAEKNEEWARWFQKNGVRVLKHAISLGKYYIHVNMPYQPMTPQDREDLITLGKRVKKMVPGCELAFIEEEYDDEVTWVFSIGWKA